MRTRLTTTAFLTLALLGSVTAQQSKPAQERTGADARAPLAQLWIEPERDRDLFYGPGGRALAPDPADRYLVIEIKMRGFSEGYTLLDSSEREWSVKFPPEAFSEVVLSRIHWGLGYHQPPIYLMREWNADGARLPNPQLPARFRAKHPDLHGLDAGGTWDFRDNPFVGTRPLAGLLVLQALFENPDIKPSNNTIYELRTPGEGASRWYVVRDIGYSLGNSRFNGTRTDIDAFEQAPFIRGVEGGKVRFHYGSQYKSSLENITVEDVRWICQRLAQLSERQWRDAFRAAAYEESVANRYIRAIKGRIAEGLALKPASAGIAGDPE